MSRTIVGIGSVLVWLITIASIVKAEEFLVTNLTEFQTALSTAQSNNEDDVINVVAGTYALDTTLTYTLSTESTENYSLTIQGAGSEETILDGSNALQILNIYTEYADDSNAHFTVRGLRFQNGNNTGQAAGLSIHTNEADMTVEGCDFINNTSLGTSHGDGGGLRLRSQNNGDILVDDCEFTGNSAWHAAGAWAISYFGTSDKVVKFTNNIFVNNTARSSYGGAYADGWSGKVIFDSNVFVGNSAVNSGGGAWAQINSSTSSPDALVLMTNNIFVDNTAGTYNGGGAYVYGGYGKSYILNNTFFNNSANSRGGGIYVYAQYSWVVEAHLYNNIFWNNTAGEFGGDLYIQDNYNSTRNAGSPIAFYNNLYNDLFIVNGNFLTQGDNILDTDPLLGENEHLTESSPCIDAGTNNVPDPPGLPSVDIDGESRISDGDKNGSEIVDIGADEWAAPTNLHFSAPTETLLTATFSGEVLVENNIPGQTQLSVVGDEIGIYDPDEVLCGRAQVVIEGEFEGLVVYGDDPNTTDVDEGAESGDVLTFRIWDSQREEELPMRTLHLNGSRQTLIWSDGGGATATLVGLAQDHVGVFRVGQNNSATWYLDADGNGTWGGLDFALTGFGIGTDTVAIGDWNGDCITDPGTVRFIDGYAWWYFDSNGNGQWDAGIDAALQFGIEGDIPAVGDWNGDGMSDFGAVRNVNGMAWWYFDSNGNRQWDSGIDQSLQFGIEGDIPVVGDWNGDGMSDFGAVRMINGMAWWYFDSNGNRAWDSGIDQSLQFGIEGDIPVVGDWNGDGMSDFGVMRDGIWYLDGNGNRQWDSGTDLVFPNYGVPADQPMGGVWR